MLKGQIYIYNNKIKYRIDGIWFLGKTQKILEVLNLNTNVLKYVPYQEFEELVKEKKMKLFC